MAGRRGDVTESLSALRLPTRSAAPPVAPVAPRATRDRRSWALGTWAALATAAAVTLAVVRPGTEPAPGPVASLPVQGSTTQVAAPPTSSSPGITVALLPRSAEPLRAVARDAGDSRVRVRRVAGTNVLVVRIEPFLMMEDSQRVALEILDEKRRVLASTRVMWRDLHGGRDVLVDAAPGLLPAGEYTLRVRPLNTGASSDGDAVHLPFAITESD